MNSKLPYDQLLDTLTAARQKVAPATRWRHYKGPEYVVDNIVFLEATDEVAVVYTPVLEPGVAFVRSLVSWLETVDWNGQTVPRFRQVN
ncbi:MAG TPA: DUF1653 domain-containing protein [Candidatus Saccharimonadales bacterium]|nr:DUF1653 domain-containing protein [Candidatus Saccharimonadales bacterium]